MRDRFERQVWREKSWKTSRHFFLSQNVHHATARAIRPAQSAERVHFAFSKCAPRHSESDLIHPKCADFAFSKSAPRHSESDSTHPKRCACHDISAQARKYCACHEICTKSSKVLRLPRNQNLTLLRRARKTGAGL